MQTNSRRTSTADDATRGHQRTAEHTIKPGTEKPPTIRPTTLTRPKMQSLCIEAKSDNIRDTIIKLREKFQFCTSRVIVT